MHYKTVIDENGMQWTELFKDDGNPIQLSDIKVQPGRNPIKDIKELKQYNKNVKSRIEYSRQQFNDYAAKNVVKASKNSVSVIKN